MKSINLYFFLLSILIGFLIPFLPWVQVSAEVKNFGRSDIKKLDELPLSVFATQAVAPSFKDSQKQRSTNDYHLDTVDGRIEWSWSSALVRETHKTLHFWGQVICVAQLVIWLLFLVIYIRKVRLYKVIFGIILLGIYGIIVLLLAGPSVGQIFDIKSMLIKEVSPTLSTWLFAFVSFGSGVIGIFIPFQSKSVLLWAKK